MFASRVATEALGVQSLEGSNINLTDEMVTMMLMQRIYELNSRVAEEKLISHNSLSSSCV